MKTLRLSKQDKEFITFDEAMDVGGIWYSTKLGTEDYKECQIVDYGTSEWIYYFCEDLNGVATLHRCKK